MIQRARGGRFIDLTGEVFGRLTVVSFSGVGPNRGTRWLCECACGTRVTIASGSLRSRHTQSCGCLHKEVIARQHTKHGGYGTDVYKTWRGMLSRCDNQKHVSYDYYSKLEPGVAEEFRCFPKFKTYVEKVLGPKPEGHSLDRIDNSLGYVPGNIRWASGETQNGNRRNVILVEYGGELICLAEVCRQRGLNYFSIRCRLKSGWSDYDAIYTPIGGKRRAS